MKIPEGWVLVPIIPTAEMVAAYDQAWEAKPPNDWGKNLDLTPEEAWAAMISAVPTQC